VKTIVRVLAMAAAVMLVAVSCTRPSGSSGGGGAWSVDPVDADPASTADPLKPSRAYTPQTTPRGALAVVLHGTTATPAAHLEMADALRYDGYHVILLRYSAQVGTTSACPDSVATTDPDCHRSFRNEVTFGAGVPNPSGSAYDHPTANVSAANSVMNRLLKLVEYMKVVSPAGGWDQFQLATGGTCDTVNANYGACELDWSKVAALGHSQGAGVALMMGKHLALRAVGMTSGSYDAFFNGATATAAPWTSEGGFAVPAGKIRTLMHSADYGAARIRAVADALGVPGPEVSARNTPFPTNRLLTSEASACPLDGAPGHNSTAVDLCTPGYGYTEAWRFLAGS
jgi:hypothetical protein